LEFPVVFLAGLNKKFNDTDLYEDILVDSKLGIASKLFDPKSATIYTTIAHEAISDRIKKDNRSEEMRILYVAMTRAKCRLVMSLCGKRIGGKIKKIAERMTMPPLESYVGSAQCLGDWLLMCAMTRSEAGELFSVGGYSTFRRVTEYPWKIAYHDAALLLPLKEACGLEEGKSAERTLITFDYPHANAVTLPEKLTATQLKGRAIDEELPQLTIDAPQLRFDKPSFEEKKKLSATQRGTAIHLAMEHIRYDKCTSREQLELEMKRLVEQERLTQEQADAVPREKLLRFFTSTLGQRVLHAENTVREFKFAILDDGALYADALAGEQVMLQGVADFCIIEDDGIVIIDFKSDRIEAGCETERAERYRGQIDAYSRALSKIFEMPVKERFLYFFATDNAFAL